VAQAIEASGDRSEAAEDQPVRSTAAAAWLVVLVLGGLGLALLLTMAFSATNTGQSIDGRTATSWDAGPPE